MSIIVYPLTPSRGGANLILKAFVTSLPPPAQQALKILWLVLRWMTVGNVSRAVIRTFLRVFLTSLLFPKKEGSSGDVGGGGSKAVATNTQVQLISRLCDAILWHRRAKELLHLLSEPCGATYLSSDDVVVAEIMRRTATVPSFVMPKSEGHRRGIAVSTTAALHGFLEGLQSGISTVPAPVSVSAFIPGLLCAPWTSLLLPVLHQHDVEIIGYDILLDSVQLEVNMAHLMQQHKKTRCGLEKKVQVLILATLRGRHFGNAPAARRYAKSNGWYVVELSVPVYSSLQQRSYLAMPAHRSHSEYFATTDVAITAFDDAGNFGGAVVELHTHACLAAYVLRRCTTATGRDNEGSIPQQRQSSAEVSCSSAPVWWSWVGHLCRAAIFETVLYYGTECYASRFTFSLQRLMESGLSTVLRLPLPSSARKAATSETKETVPDTKSGVEANMNEPITSTNVSQKGESNETKGEENIVVITAPLPPLSHSCEATAEGCATTSPPENSPSKPSSDKDPANGRNSRNAVRWPSLSFSIPSLCRESRSLSVSPFSSGEGLEQAEWRIRIRWMCLFLQSCGSYTQNAGPAIESAATSERQAADAAFLSLWSLILDLDGSATKSPTAPLASLTATLSDGGSYSPLFVASADSPDSKVPWDCTELSSSCVLLWHPTSNVVSSSIQVLQKNLQEVAHVEAKIVSPISYTDYRTRDTTKSPVCFHEVVYFDDCIQARQVVKQLVYVPFSTTMSNDVREAVLRELVPASKNSTDASAARKEKDSSVVSTVLHDIYSRYLAMLQKQESADAVAPSIHSSELPPLHHSCFTLAEKKLVYQHLFGQINSFSQPRTPLAFLRWSHTLGHQLKGCLVSKI